MNHHPTRFTMLGLLLCGLLLLGIGAGVSFAEFSRFSYAGPTLIHGAESRTAHFTIDADAPDQPVELDLLPLVTNDIQQLSAVLHIRQSDAMSPGTMELTMNFHTHGLLPAMDPVCSQPDTPQTFFFYWHTVSDPIAMTMAAKDQVLQDIKHDRIGSYVFSQADALILTVNPADAGRLSIPGISLHELFSL